MLIKRHSYGYFMQPIISIFVSLWLFTAGLSQTDSTQAPILTPDSSLDSSLKTDTVAADTNSVDSDSTATSADRRIEKKKPIPPQLTIKAFKVGEKLTFKIRYGFIKAGEAVMQVKDTLRMNGIPVYHLQTTARSVPAFDWIFKVRDEVNSYVTVNGFYSLRFEKKLREGGYKVDLIVDYNHEDSLAHVRFFRYDRDDKNQDFKVKIPPYINDILSSFYYVRNKTLKVGQSFYLQNHEKEKVYNLEIKIHRKETLEVDAGTFRCLVVEPMLKGEGIFKQEGRLLVWLTDDEYKIPVQMTSEVLVGHITTELIRMEGVPNPIPARLE